MERVLDTHKPPKFASQDVISTMPESVITNILDRLPIQDAVRTCILSTNWKLKWTLLTQLVFDVKFFKYLLLNDNADIFAARIIITKLLHRLKGPITRFVLNKPNLDVLDVGDIYHWVMYLSGKGIMDLTLTKWHGAPYNLSTHLFSCLDLTDLALIGFSIHLTPNFSGFPNLLNLDLDKVTLENGNIGEIINQCPLLEILVITNYDPVGKVKLVHIAKHENLTRLSLPIRKLDDISSIRSYIFQLGSSLPKLQRLTLSFSECKILGEGETCAINLVHTVFPSLKTLELYGIDLNSDSMLSCAIKMIWGSPNLQTLTVVVRYEDDDEEEEDDDDDDTHPPSPSPHGLTSSQVDCDTLGKLQLQYVKVVCLGSEDEVRLIKHVLACSPLLKKIVINTYMISDGKLEFVKKLLKLHRASPIVDVKVSDSCSLLNFLSDSYNQGY